MAATKRRPWQRVRANLTSSTPEAFGIRCAICGDEARGPWGVHRGALLCECCLDALAAVRHWRTVIKPGPNVPPEEALRELLRWAFGEH
jgi:hypothetical protein